MSPNNTTIIFVHGAWHTPWHYTSLLTGLKDAGYPVVCPQLPSVSSSDADFSRDVDLIRHEIKTAVDSGQKVALVMHSYGGIAGGEAAASFKADVVKLVYLAAFAVPGGKSLMDMLGGNPLPWWRSTEDGAGWVAIDEERIFYNDTTDEEELRGLKERLGTQAQGVMRSKTTWEPYREISSAYLLCERDEAIPVPAQEGMISAAGIKEVRRIEAGHSPWLAKGEETVKAVVDAIGGRL
ncbi:alpha/beta-hydrolase [Myriangium duriaei CBS 260.36]|uniref:Alpha/beta-hydrolase n=1 Tax=Myriangium duriaei CBS 260.36 TaxID=1168546 RepID=A0A9P4J462_9PEZI|nr:alpha/beta-hydrolase [Myriangium duriaei CBS 260.36]